MVIDQTCPKCGAKNPQNARFCNQCAAALDIPIGNPRYSYALAIIITLIITIGATRIPWGSIFSRGTPATTVSLTPQSIIGTWTRYSPSGTDTVIFDTTGKMLYTINSETQQTNYDFIDNSHISIDNRQFKVEFNTRNEFQLIDSPMIINFIRISERADINFLTTTNNANVPPLKTNPTNPIVLPTNTAILPINTAALPTNTVIPIVNTSVPEQVSSNVLGSWRLSTAATDIKLACIIGSFDTLEFFDDGTFIGSQLGVSGAGTHSLLPGNRINLVVNGQSLVLNVNVTGNVLTTQLTQCDPIVYQRNKIGNR